MLNTCSVCGEGGRVGRMLCEQDLRENPQHPLHHEYQKYGSAVGSQVDVCIPMSPDAIARKMKPGGDPQAAAAASVRCLQTVLQNNPALKFKSIGGSPLGDHWTY